MTTQISYPRQGYIKRNLLGALEIALFMPQGAKRFSVSKEGMLRSCIIPFLVLPVTALTFISAHPDSLSVSATQALSAVYILRTIVYLLSFLGFAYLVSKYLDRKESFYQLAAAHNWLLLPAAILTLPLTIAFIHGLYSWQEVFPLITCITIYFYASLAYMSVKVLQIPKELGVFIAIACLALNQTALDVVKFVASQAFFYLA